MALFPRGVAPVIAVLALWTAGPVQAAPLIDSTLLKGGAVAGRLVELQVRAADREAPVTGMVVGFGGGESRYGLSNCLPPDSLGRPFGPIATPGRKVVLAAPHVYSRAGRRSLVTNVTSGGCTAQPASTAQTVRVQVVRPGEKPKPIITLPPVNLPALPVQLPTIPGLPAVPPLPALPAAKTLRKADCPGRNRRFTRTAKGEDEAKAALLCLLNAERSRRGLRPLRPNPKLERAARLHSQAMVRRRFFAHVGPGASSPAARLRPTRYLPRTGYWVIGENIGFGTGSLSRPASIHRAWMHSTPHRAAMLSRRFRRSASGSPPASRSGPGGPRSPPISAPSADPAPGWREVLAPIRCLRCTDWRVVRIDPTLGA